MNRSHIVTWTKNARRITFRRKRARKRKWDNTERMKKVCTRKRDASNQSSQHPISFQLRIYCEKIKTIYSCWKSFWCKFLPELNIYRSDANRLVCRCVYGLLVPIFCSKMVIHVSRFIFNVNFSAGFLIFPPPFLSFSPLPCCMCFGLLFIIFICFPFVHLWSCARVLCHLDVSVSVWFFFAMSILHHEKKGTHFIRLAYVFPVSISFRHQRIKTHGKIFNFISHSFLLYQALTHEKVVCACARLEWLNDRTRVILNANIKKSRRISNEIWGWGGGWC